MTETELKTLIKELVSHSQETEWLEFKLNFHSNQEIGERISALANGACLSKKQYGFLVFGIEDKTHNIKGTTFKVKTATKGQEELENWLIQRLDPRIDFKTYEFEYSEGINISMYIIPAAVNRPVKFTNQAYIRIGSYTRLLKEFPEKESKIWNKKDNVKFELQLAKENIDADSVVSL
jgi:ATP-dependent DNA helicase RecG